MREKNQVTHAQQMRKRAQIFINLAPLWQESFAGYHMSHIKCTNTGKPVSFRLRFNIYPLIYIYIQQWNNESVLVHVHAHVSDNLISHRRAYQKDCYHLWSSGNELLYSLPYFLSE